MAKSERLPSPRTDLPFGETVLLQGDADFVAADTRRFFSKQRVERAAADGERQRVGREVHDGALQALTGVSLQLSALATLIASDPTAAIALVRNLEQLVSNEQRALRGWLSQQAQSAPLATTSGQQLSSALAALCLRAESQWGLRIEFREGVHRAIPQALGEHVYRIVQEAIANVGKHAHATHVVVQLRASVSEMQIIATDDGAGFPFRGEFDLADLQQRGVGPRSLLQRVASLNGELRLTSTLSGSRIDIRLKLPAALRAFTSA